jgi:hypothetical protein
MGIPVHVVDQLNGSQFNLQDRVLKGMLANLATPASATSVSVLGAITAGTGFTNINTVTLAPSGGTGTGLAAIPTSLKNISDTIASPGTGYAISDTITLAGGTLQPGGPGTATVLTVSKAQLVGLAINAGGAGSTAGYAVNDVLTLVGGTSTTAAQVTVLTVDGGGGILTFSISRGGVYSVEASTFTVTGGTGTGATFKTAVWGVQAVTVSTAGAYTAVPASPVAQGSTSGTGTGVMFTSVWGLGSAQITNSGNYSGAPSMTVTDSASGTGASIATVTLGGNGNPIFVPITFSLPPTYSVQVEPSMNCQTYVPYASKTTTGFSVALVPPTTGSTLSAGTIDVEVVA